MLIQFYGAYRKIIQALLVVCLVFIFILGFPSQVVASPCTIGWGGETSLPSNLKDILLSRRSVPVSSPDFGDTASFKNLIIVYRKALEGTVETGKDISFEDLKNATGYAKVAFTVLKSFNEIPVIKDVLNSKYPGLSQLIKVNNVKAKLLFHDPNGKLVRSSDFRLEEWRNQNEIPICDFESIKSGVKDIVVKLDSFDGGFHFSHHF